MVGELEVMSDREGAIVTGWVAPDVLYVQFVEYLTGPLGMKFAMRLEPHLAAHPKVQLFADCSGLDSYDFTAREACSRVLFAQRRRLSQCLFLVRTRVVELGMQAISAMLGGGLMEVNKSHAEFMSRLGQAAPNAWRSIRNPRAWVPVKNSLLP
ncbi:MAG TPA: hypothetical protein VG937_22275 [Polyangiaceae bacterium]|jgi:hypothetical protein|nr:hypothetical protein [Polyangiaceae bacterium]